jgi:hypothetical protein
MNGLRRDNDRRGWSVVSGCREVGASKDLVERRKLET